MVGYLAPVNLDTGGLEAALAQEEDRRANPLAVKGPGEIALVGMAPAVDPRRTFEEKSKS